MNRHQRRALAKIQDPSSLGQVADKIQEAVEALGTFKEVPEQVGEAQRLMVESHTMVMALVEDVQGMADEMEALKAVVLVLAGSGAERAFARRVAAIRAKRLAEDRDL